MRTHNAESTLNRVADFLLDEALPQRWRLLTAINILENEGFSRES